MNMATLEYRVEGRAKLTDELIAQSAKLFSTGYGVWGKGATAGKMGSRVKISSRKLRQELLFDDTCFVSLALQNERVVGQAFCKRFPYQPLAGTVVWITQLVVQPLLRHQGVATELIKHAVSQPSDVAAGLVSSHPYAIRALESGTNRRVVPELLPRYAQNIIQASQVPYMQGAKITGYTIDTDFYVDHTEVDSMREHERQSGRWKLGPLEDGHETIGIVFLKDQKEDQPAPARRQSGLCSALGMGL